MIFNLGFWYRPTADEKDYETFSCEAYSYEEAVQKLKDKYRGLCIVDRHIKLIN